MANITAAPAAETDEITIDFVTLDETPGSKYSAHVQRLIDADAQRTDEQIADGLHASLKLEFPKTENGKPAAERYKRWFRESAGLHNVSAKVISETDLGDSVQVQYAVVPKIVRPRKPKAVETATDDAPETVAA